MVNQNPKRIAVRTMAIESLTTSRSLTGAIFHRHHSTDFCAINLCPGVDGKMIGFGEHSHRLIRQQASIVSVCVPEGTPTTPYSFVRNWSAPIADFRARD